jgi:cold shock protein
MATGTVRKWVGDHGFGFITPDDGGEDLFVHIRNCVTGSQLREGQRVRFDERPNKQHHGKFEACGVALL